MDCNVCHNTKGVLDESPFEKLETLFKNIYAELEVSTHKCKACNSLYVGIDLEPLDSNRSYWVEITYDEVQELLKLKGLPEIVDLARQLIQSKDSHISCDREGNYYYKQESAVVV